MSVTMSVRVWPYLPQAFLSVETAVNSQVKGNVAHGNRCFEIYGIDILLDESLKPWRASLRSMRTRTLTDPGRAVKSAVRAGLSRACRRACVIHSVVLYVVLCCMTG